MREPSLHITKSNLVLILKEVLKDSTSLDINKLADTVLKKGRAFPCNNRIVVMNTNKLAKDAERVAGSDLGPALKFQSILIKVRKSLKHVGVTIMKPGSKDWLSLKEVTKAAVEFCKTFNLKQDEGFVIYCKMGLSKMNKYNIHKFASLDTIINEQMEAEMEIEDDMYSDLSMRLHQFYVKEIHDRIGNSHQYLDDPINYRSFVRAAKEVMATGGKGVDYIKAQFEAFTWNNSLPQPAQLYGPKARERFIKYAYAHNIRLKSMKK